MNAADLVLRQGDHRAGRLPRHSAGERFLRGPIPWTWLLRAMSLPGRALHVGLHVWQLAGMRGSAVVALSLSRLGVERTSASRGLAALERAGLVQVARGRGRKPIVTILAPTTRSAEAPWSAVSSGRP
ncbi:MAG TPA: hypothetical protein VK762_28935 [Polyangiaceae bacterium]|jgi:hypothetical protein|nr:hypothetical protein [Polyangiaceae bacterium]